MTVSVGDNTSLSALPVLSSNLPVKPVLRHITQVQDVLNKRKYQSQLENPSSLFIHEKKMLKTALGSAIHNPENVNERTIYQHCHNLMKNAFQDSTDKDNYRKAYHHAKESIAKLVLLAGQDINQALGVVKSSNPAKKLNKAIDSWVSTIKQHLEQVVATHRKVGLQNVESAYFVAFHLEIFKALMLPDGRLNVGLIPCLLIELLDDKSLDAEWKKQTRAILEKIQSSKDIQLKAACIKKPDPANTLANRLIRITLDVSPDKDITDLDAKIVAASGMMPIRQGPVGNCFVICNAIWFVNAVLDKTLTDYSQILQFGQLIRMQGDQKMEYPIDFDINDPDLDASFQINECGKLKGGAYLWESPGIRSACLQLGLNDPETLLKNFIREYSDTNGKGGGFEMTPRNLFKLLAKLSAIKDDEENLVKIACLAFSSKTNMPLIHAWTSALAAMDQSQQSSSLHDKINKCWNSVFTPTWEDLQKDIAPSVINRIQSIFKEQINGRWLIEYDESVETPLAADGSSTAGAFVYFERNLDASATSAQPIRSYKDLTRYASNTLAVVEEKLKQDAYLPSKECEKTVAKIRNFIQQGDKFADTVLSNYDDSLKGSASLADKWEKFTDFGKIGGDNVHVFELAMGFPLPSPMQAGQATARERLVSIIQFLRDREQKDHFIETPEEERYEMDSDDHAFTIPTDNPTILPFVKSSQDVDNLIEAKIFQPCQAVSQAPITEEQKNLLLKESVRLAPKELSQKLKDLVSQIHEKAIHEYSNAVFKILVNLNPGIDESAKSTLLAKFTNAVLYQVLTESQLKIIKDATVLGPDTNWVDDDKQRHKLLEIFFAFTLNPVTNQIEFFEIDEDSSGLYSLSQADWIGGPWDMYGLNLGKSDAAAQKTS